MIAMFTDISDAMYEQYGLDNAGGMDYFSQFESQLEGCDRVLLVSHQMKSYPLAYVIDFLLSLPGLWVNFDLEDWKRLFIEANPRRRVHRGELLSELSAFSDIHLLFRYIRIDPLPLIVSIPQLPSSEKAWILDYCEGCASVLLCDASDALDGQHFVSNECLKNVRSVLIQGGLKQTKNTVNEFRENLSMLRKFV